MAENDNTHNIDNIVCHGDLTAVPGRGIGVARDGGWQPAGDGALELGPVPDGLRRIQLDNWEVVDVPDRDLVRLPREWFPQYSAWNSYWFPSGDHDQDGVPTSIVNDWLEDHGMPHLLPGGLVMIRRLAERAEGVVYGITSGEGPEYLTDEEFGDGHEEEGEEREEFFTNNWQAVSRIARLAAARTILGEGRRPDGTAFTLAEEERLLPKLLKEMFQVSEDSSGCA